MLAEADLERSLLFNQLGRLLALSCLLPEQRIGG
jgi:hypothetical protein